MQKFFSWKGGNFAKYLTKAYEGKNQTMKPTTTKIYFWNGKPLKIIM